MRSSAQKWNQNGARDLHEFHFEVILRRRKFHSSGISRTRINLCHLQYSSDNNYKWNYLFNEGLVQIMIKLCIKVAKKRKKIRKHEKWTWRIKDWNTEFDRSNIDQYIRMRKASFPFLIGMQRSILGTRQTTGQFHSLPTTHSYIHKLLTTSYSMNNKVFHSYFLTLFK